MPIGAICREIGWSHQHLITRFRLTTPEIEELAQHVTHLRYRVRRP